MLKKPYSALFVLTTSSCCNFALGSEEKRESDGKRKFTNGTKPHKNHLHTKQQANAQAPKQYTYPHPCGRTEG
jgi:hypothetical protein